MRRMRFPAKYLAPFLPFLLACAANQQVSFVPVNEAVLRLRLGAIERSNPDRFAKLKEMFEDSGCSGEQLTEKPVKGSKLPNLICALKGESEDVVIVAAHFDQVGVAEGAVDNWSGASILPSLFQSMNGQSRHLTYLFVGFTDEERGLVGSQSMVKQLGAEGLSHVKAMINIDSIGMTPTKVWVRRSDKNLLIRLQQLANSMKLELSGMNVDGVGESDSRYFADKKVPVLDIHSVTPETMRILHSSKDVPAAIDFANYRNTYQLIAGFLAYADTFLTQVGEPPVSR